MKLRYPSFTRTARLLEAQLLFIGWMATLMLGLYAAPLSMRGGMQEVPTTVLSDAGNGAEGGLLTPTDRGLYRMIFAAEERGESALADRWMKALSNRTLVGHVLAIRYLRADSNPSAEALQTWLSESSEHPDAAQIARIAQARGIVLPRQPAAEAPLKGDGFADNLGRTTMPDGWYRGLSLWREGQYSAALPLFTAIATNESLSDWQQSAGYYWAARAAAKTGNRAQSDAYLAQATKYPTTFYGLLAATDRGDAPRLSARAPALPDHIRTNPQAVQAAMLVEIGRSEDAERQLRHLYSDLAESERPSIITLADTLHLPNLQVRLARMPGLSREEALFASYPMPQQMIDAQKAISPALVLAIARNESGFRESAASGSGALGMMQMLPSTARAIERRMGHAALNLASAGSNLTPIAERLSDPATSARYGAQYLNILANEPAVGHSLVRMLAAYNAGPGNVASWQAAARGIDDPLLYIESIPYPETRNYVMQVLAQFWVYQQLLGEHNSSLSNLADGHWPKLG